MNILDLSEQEIIRRNSLKEMINLGINPYPAEEFKISNYSDEIHEKFNPELNNFQEITMAGRIMTRRIMGSASFAEIKDDKGRMQLYFRRDDLCPGDDKTLYNTVFKKLLDIVFIRRASKKEPSFWLSGEVC